MYQASYRDVASAAQENHVFELLCQSFSPAKIGSSQLLIFSDLPQQAAGVGHRLFSSGWEHDAAARSRPAKNTTRSH